MDTFGPVRTGRRQRLCDVRKQSTAPEFVEIQPPHAGDLFR